MTFVSTTNASGNDMWPQSLLYGSVAEFNYPCSVALNLCTILASVADHSTGDPRIWEKSI